MKYIKLSYRLLLVVFALTGLYLAFTIPSFMSDHILDYYTFQSNLLVLIFFLILCIINTLEIISKKEFNLKILYLIKYIVTVAITITFVVFHTLISGNTLIIHIANLIVHYIVPLMTLIDFLIFDKKYNIASNQVVFSLVYPLIYLLFILFRPKSGNPFINLDGSLSNYPYFFLDIDRFGWFQIHNGLGVFYWICLFLVGIIILGNIILLLKKIISKKVGFN